MDQDTNFSGMPKDVESRIRAMGQSVDGSRTGAIYRPFFNTEPYSGKLVHRDLSYGPDERHVLDLFTTPKTKSAPVLVFVPGGAFRSGAKSTPGSPFYDNIMNWAADQGMVGAAINYRLSPEYQWPSGIEDLDRVVDWVRSEVGAMGGDTEKLFLWGHSAGAAHVADYLAWKANRTEEAGVAGAILSSGFYELGPEVSIWSSYYGEDVSTYPERSALPGLLKSSVPLFVNDAELDPERFKPDTARLVQAFAAASKPLTYLQLLGHSHLSEVYAIGTKDESLSGPVRDFISQNVRTKLTR